MVRTPFWLKLAAREARSSARRLGVYMGAITVGVAALVAINSFRAQVVQSVDAESRALLGADLRLDSNRAFPDSVEALLDSAATAGIPMARVTGTMSTALTAAGDVRLVQLRAVDGPFPLYGTMTSEPAGAWPPAPDRRDALLEAALIDQFGLATGDSIRLGAAWFRVAGALTALPPEMSFRNALGPRVYIHAAHLPATELIQFGALARWEAYLQIPDPADLQRFLDRNHDTFRSARVRMDTAAEQAEDLSRALELLGRFLGLVGLGALLLGGLGVASAVNVFVTDKRRTVAVLRCLGATQRTAFTAYMLQATSLGTIGAALGALLGVAIQAAIPRAVADLLPVDVPFRVQWDVVLIGIAIGAIVAGAFSLMPLLAIRGVSPLRALRYDVDVHEPRLDPWRIAAFILIVASVAAIAIWQARFWTVGLAYAGALVAGLLVLWICARLLVAITRRTARRGIAAVRAAGSASGSGSGRRRAFPLRQGVANLHRPRNQTIAVTMALGFGVFLVATLWIVQVNLLDWIRGTGDRPAPDLVLFDIQRDQVHDVQSIIARHAHAPPDIVPIIPARIAAINDTSVADLLEQRRTRRIEPWAVRREYRHTSRDSLTGGETLVAGEWFDRDAPRDDGIARVSIEQDVAQSLGVGIGDRITWDITGVRVPSIITSIRTVEWTRFETNFFFVFEPGPLDAAPQTMVSLISIPDEAARAAAQRDVVRQFANVTVVDVGSVQRIFRRIVGRVAAAIRFMAAFSVGAGALVLFGAIAASRFQRVRESALLRALGATRTQIRSIMLVEYAALGALAAITGTALASIAGWLLTRFLFRLDFILPVGPLAFILIAVTVAAAALGMLNSREALRSTPLGALREAES